ncbi:hypothetical protein K2173_021362 [Erythroxylum novogranatense]|uniref:Uncharacterized protein n=1 Tax=Erythroxylum novogranatense TaxID=1862640 RepID=A0AAV8TXY9_9ROSI|nr:hypothetical protein K2173_021362 [Erythroxylum novogranatense]
MGLCVSSAAEEHPENEVGVETTNWSSTIKVIGVEGKLQEFDYRVKASYVTTLNPNCFICSLESMSPGICAPKLPDDEELQLGQLYFLLPLSQIDKPLSLPDLCALAIKASSVLGEDSIEFSSRNQEVKEVVRI